MRTGRPLKRSVKVAKCWRASSVVGTTTATWKPSSAATKAALSATSVLPKPTSPHTSRSMGLPEARSSSTVPMLAVWSSVSPYGKRATNSSNAPSGGAIAGAWRSWRSAATLISSEAISRMRCLRRALRVCQATPPRRSSCTAPSAEP